MLLIFHYPLCLKNKHLFLETQIFEPSSGCHALRSASCSPFLLKMASSAWTCTSFQKPNVDLSDTNVLEHIFKIQSVYFGAKQELKNYQVKYGLNGLSAVRCKKLLLHLCIYFKENNKLLCQSAYLSLMKTMRTTGFSLS